MKGIRVAVARLAGGSNSRERKLFFSLALLLVLVFAMGGASRGDVSSLPILRPIAILLLGYGLWGLGWDQIKSCRYLFGPAFAMVAVTLVQLVPLPPVIWSALPGRQIVVEIDRIAGLSDVWRPISLVPAATWNSFYAMLVPLGVLVLGARLSVEARTKLLPVVIVIGVTSALLALLQLIGPIDGPLYFYRVTNFGAAVGLFANRNHEAMLLASLFPMLAVFASLSGRERGWVVAVGTSVFLIPLVLVTGSRFGLLGAVIGILSGFWLYRPHAARSIGARRSHRIDRGRDRRVIHRPATMIWTRWRLAAIVGFLGLSLSVVTIFFGRAEAFQRILQGDSVNEFRFKAWGLVTQMVGEYFPLGTGMGSFAEVFQLKEPRSLLDSTYFNHAHNDWLEVLVTGGLPALILLLCTCVLVAARILQVVRRAKRPPTAEDLFARLGLVLIIQFAIASLADYPLRTPSLASLFALAALWAATPLSRPGLAVDAR